MGDCYDEMIRRHSSDGVDSDVSGRYQHWPLDQASSSSSCSVAHGQEMYTERLSMCQMFSRSEGRVAWAGTVLALLQSVGFIISLYLLVNNYSSNTDLSHDDPHQHVCVEAVLCLMSGMVQLSTTLVTPT